MVHALRRISGYNQAAFGAAIDAFLHDDQNQAVEAAKEEKMNLFQLLRKQKKHVPIPCVELGVPQPGDVVLDTGIRRVDKCFQEEIGTLSVTPSGCFADADGIIVNPRY